MKALAGLGLALLLAGLLQACISPLTVSAGDEDFLVYPTSGEPWTAQSLDREMLSGYGPQWQALNLSAQQKQSIADFLSHGYSARVMPESEYAIFLSNANYVNSDPDNCGYYSAVAFNGGVTGYVFEESSEKNAICAAKSADTYAWNGTPQRCSATASVLPFLNDLAAGSEGRQPPEAPAPGEAAEIGVASAELASNGSGAEAAPPGQGQQDWNAIGTIAAGASMALVALLAGGFIVFTLMNRKQTPVDYESLGTHRALASTTRVSLMKELVARDLTPTDLSTRVGKSKATVVEHLERLMDADLVEKVERSGRKYVFYRLTPKGKSALREAG
jgi:DNA-binding MarR family transcriptional regulator